MKCFYHSADLDGHCSGAIVKHLFPECEMVPINYGGEFPWKSVANETVYMVDFGLPIEDMVRLDKIADLCWIDHHKTAIEAADRADFNPAGLRGIGVGACEIAWTYLTDEPVPRAVRLLSMYDVWNHSDPDVLLFQYGMRLHEDTRPGNDNLWGKLFSRDWRAYVELTIERGKTIWKYEISQNKKKCDSMAFESEFEYPNGRKLNAICCNLGMVNSQLFDSVWDPEKHDVMVAFCRRNGVWNVSLYTTKDDIDCGEIAKSFGGGGHKQVAGFSCKDLPLMVW